MVGMVFRWRPIEAEDAAACAALSVAIQAADGGAEVLSEQDVLDTMSDPNYDFSRGSMAVFDGTVLAGYCVLMKRTAADPVHEMYQQGGVNPRYRGRGLGGKLMEWAERAAVPIHEDAFPGRPLSLVGFYLQGNASAAALFESFGYQPRRWMHVMTMDLGSAKLGEAPASPSGVEIVGFTPERSQDAQLVRDEAFADHWGSTPSTADSWAHLIGTEAFRPAFSFLGYEAGEPLGLILAYEYDAYREVTGIRDLFIGIVGTRRAGRKRGIASALLTRTLTLAQAAGYGQASLYVQADSMTGAVGLYQRIGFGISHSTVTQAKVLIAA
jgi:mycothiol synthase